MDKVFEPFMAGQSKENLLVQLFGEEKGSGAAMLFFIMGIVGVMICVVFSWILRWRMSSQKPN